VALHFYIIKSMIVEYPSMEIEAKLNTEKSVYKYWTCMYSKEDSPVGKEEPYIEIDVVVTKKEDQNSPSLSEGVEVLVFDDTCIDMSRVISYCNINNNDYEKTCDILFHHSFAFDDNDTSLYQKLPINITEKYYLVILNCENTDITLKGKIIWRNPYGYLPGDVYMMLHVSGILSLAYAFIVIFFGVLSIRYRRILMKLQYGILGIILFGLIEVSSWYFYRVGTNNTGIYNISSLLFLVFLANVKQSTDLVLVLLISMGLGVVKWTIGTTRIKIGLLAVFYMFFSFLYQTMREVFDLEKKRDRHRYAFFISDHSPCIPYHFFRLLDLSFVDSYDATTHSPQTSSQAPNVQNALWSISSFWSFVMSVWNLCGVQED